MFFCSWERTVGGLGEETSGEDLSPVPVERTRRSDEVSHKVFVNNR